MNNEVLTFLQLGLVLNFISFVVYVIHLIHDIIKGRDKFFFDKLEKNTRSKWSLFKILIPYLTAYKTFSFYYNYGPFSQWSVGLMLYNYETDQKRKGV
jgi:hypothetical protein